MKSIWQQALLRWCIGIGLSFAIGLAIDHAALCLFLFTLFYLGLNMYQLYQFHDWLQRSGKSAAPDASGIWGDVFSAVNRLQVKQRKSKRRMRRALKRIENSTTALREGVIMADHTGKLEWWNQAAESLLGVDRSACQGCVITDLIRHSDFIHYFSQKRFGEPLVVQLPEKEGLYLEIQTTLYDKNDHLIFIRDVTRLHLLEQMRTDFIANASHELKTPLTVIKGYLEMLDMFKDSFPKSMQRGVINMTEQSNRMEQLIEDLLLLSRLESNDRPNHDQWNDIGDLISNICNAVRIITTDQHSIKVDLRSDAKLYGSYSELYSAFSNLVVNAIKYSPEGGEITIKWDTNDFTGVFSVQDSGLGINPRFIPRLTERFFRVDKGRGSSTGGTGLGLAIVKHVLIHHNAKLQIRSQLGYGSTFSCHFPVDRIQSKFAIGADSLPESHSEQPPPLH